LPKLANMKSIKIKISNFDANDKCSYGYYILNTLKKYYEVEISNEPDYLFFNESTYEHLSHNCIKIFYTGENFHPNFNVCDYAFGFDYMNFGDRYYRFPIYFIATFYREKELKDMQGFNLLDKINFTYKDLASKKEFCSFVYSNYLADSNRKDFFDILSKYKKINSGGAYLNNTGGRVDNKLEFESRHKFSIAFENSSNDGYTTEKLLNSLAAKTIPIYWGNPKINLEFNTRRFINCHEFSDFDAVKKEVEEIDKNDNLYLEMINQPILNNDNYFKETINGFEAFIKNIIEQPINKAGRIKINPAKRRDMLEGELILSKFVNRKNKKIKILANLYKPFKKIAVIEKAKQNYFIKKNG
jgi:hypothetical protein